MTTPAPNSPEPPATPPTHHWVISVQWPGPVPGSLQHGTWSNTVHLSAGATRAEAYEQLRGWLMKTVTGGKEPTVLYFAIDRNTL
ncbi:hypothetical protein ACFU51_28400 [Streptomyces sp. NPDC057430]|uniref:hypothetical protein n=1 Tax=Streptomyces sp. NPDC057430 TaxID=3346131 RepID=UPI003678CBF7